MDHRVEEVRLETGKSALTPGPCFIRHTPALPVERRFVATSRARLHFARFVGFRRSSSATHSFSVALTAVSQLFPGLTTVAQRIKTLRSIFEVSMKGNGWRQTFPCTLWLSNL
jgi:hypothetical protein